MCCSHDVMGEIGTLGTCDIEAKTTDARDLQGISLESELFPTFAVPLEKNACQILHW